MPIYAYTPTLESLLCISFTIFVSGPTASSTGIRRFSTLVRLSSWDSSPRFYEAKNDLGSSFSLLCIVFYSCEFTSLASWQVPYNFLFSSCIIHWIYNFKINAFFTNYKSHSLRNCSEGEFTQNDIDNYSRIEYMSRKFGTLFKGFIFITFSFFL